MNIIRTVILAGLCSFIFCVTAYCQDQSEKKDNEELNAPHHRITIMMANAHVPGASETGSSKKNFIVPAWGFDYDFWFSKKWAIGLHNDVVLQHYKVEKSESNTEIIRSNPFSASLAGLYKPGKHFVFIAGVGREFEKNESLNLMDLGIEYGWELPKKWELSLNLKYENKFSAYDSYLFGIGFSKILTSKYLP